MPPAQVAARAAAAAPDEPEAPDYSKVLRQFIVLPILWGSNKINLDDPDNMLVLQCVFVTVIALGYGLIQVAIFRARRTNDQSRVLNPGSSTYIHEEDTAQDGSVSARVYDVAKLRESKLQFLMSAGMVVFLNLKWSYTQPLLMICIMQPLQLWDNKALHIHLRDKSGPGYERPWKAANADNPLAQWAERKKAEQQEAQAADKKRE